MKTADPRQGTRFAVYLCPEAGSAYYELGSTLLGYDVRARQETALPEWIDPAWQTAASPYGLHLTLVEGFYCDAASLPAIEAELRACLVCLSPRADLHLSGGHMDAWNGGAVLAHVFTPSPHLLMLHAFLLARLAGFVTHSPFEDELAQHPERYRTPWERARLELLRTPRGLDSFQPHFTLIQPYSGPDAEQLRARLETLVAPYSVQSFQRVALFVKPEGQARWQLQADVPLSAPTSPS